MKVTLLLMAFCCTISMYAQVGIGTTNPDASAALDITSTTDGFLPPRLTLAQRNGISNPAAGLVVWCSDCNELQVFDGVVWKNMSGEIASPIGPPTIGICDQEWTAKNLDVTTYRNGNPIPHVTDATAWAALTSGAYTYFNNDSATYAAVYGKLYNWYAVADPRGLCPTGSHVATDAEWTALETCLGSATIAGGKLKETGTSHWQSPNVGATNSVGFTAVPGGHRSSTGTFALQGLLGNYWTSTANGSVAAWYRYLSYSEAVINTASGSKKNGYSVRCIRD